MTQTKRLVIDQLKLRYEGLFDASQLYRTIDGWFYEKHWDKKELVNSEFVRENGKQLIWHMQPWKSITDYHKLWLHVRVNIIDLQEVEVEIEGIKKRMGRGKFFMIIDGFVFSDRQGQWGKKPFWWFLQMVAELYFFKSNYTKAEAWLLSDVEDLREKIKSFFNMYSKYDRGAIIPFMRS